MKRIQCKNCKNEWFMDEKDYFSTRYCPFCKIEIDPLILQQSGELGQVILNYLLENGISGLEDSKAFIMYVNKNNHENHDENNMFKRACDKNEILELEKAFAQNNIDDADKVLVKLKNAITNKTEINDDWAQYLYEEFHRAAELFLLEKEKKSAKNWKNMKKCYTLVKVS